ncbi:MAG: hypothetical protein Q9159_000363 [Coniocarpon cinnabarinum]
MEAAASIAGLVTLAGNILQSCQSIRAFYRDFKTINRITTDALDDLDELSKILEHLRRSSSGRNNFKLSTVVLLDQHLQRCESDVKTWLVDLQSVQQSGAASRIKRFGRRDANEHIICQLNQINSTQATITSGVQMMSRLMSPHYQSQATLEHIDSRLNTTEARLLNAITLQPAADSSTAEQNAIVKCQHMDLVEAQQTPKEFHWRSRSQSETRTSEELCRLVDTRVVIRQKHGKILFDVTAAQDDDFEAAPLPKKLAIIRQVQRMRLMIWLLRSENMLSYRTQGHALALQTPSIIQRQDDMSATLMQNCVSNYGRTARRPVTFPDLPLCLQPSFFKVFVYPEIVFS